MFTLKKSLLTASVISLSISAVSVANAASHEKVEAMAKEAMADKEAMVKEAMAEKEAMAKDAMAKDAMAKDAMAKDAMAKDAMAKDAMAKDAMAKDAMAKEAMVKEAMVKEAMVKEAMVKEAMAEKEAMAKDAMAKDAMAKDAMAKDAMAKDAMAEGDSVVALVNGEKILNSTLEGYLEVLSQSRQGQPDLQSALDDLIATEIALQEARKSDILEREESKKAIKDYTRNVLLQTWTKEKVESFNIDDAAIKEAYDERVANLASKEFNARHILVKTEDEAKAIITEVNAEGADFAAVAKEKSTGPSSSNGGSLGWFKATTMVPAFANAVKDMKKGDISKEPVKTQFGFHVIKLEDSRDSKLPTIDSLKDQLERVISQKQMLAYMEELKKSADIKITLPEMTKEMEKAHTHDKDHKPH